MLGACYIVALLRYDCYGIYMTTTNTYSIWTRDGANEYAVYQCDVKADSHLSARVTRLACKMARERWFGGRVEVRDGIEGTTLRVYERTGGGVSVR